MGAFFLTVHHIFLRMFTSRTVWVTVVAVVVMLSAGSTSLPSGPTQTRTIARLNMYQNPYEGPCPVLSSVLYIPNQAAVCAPWCYPSDVGGVCSKSRAVSVCQNHGSGRRHVCVLPCTKHSECWVHNTTMICIRHVCAFPVTIVP